MKNVLDYLNTLDAEFIEQFYSVRINKNFLYLQGRANKQNLVAVQHLGAVNIYETWIVVSYAVDTIQIEITLTLEEQ
jgi:hypothetical protein